MVCFGSKCCQTVARRVIHKTQEWCLSGELGCFDRSLYGQISLLDRYMKIYLICQSYGVGLKRSELLKYLAVFCAENYYDNLLNFLIIMFYMMDNIKVIRQDINCLKNLLMIRPKIILKVLKLVNF